ALEELPLSAEVAVGVDDRHLSTSGLSLAFGPCGACVYHFRPRALDLGLLVEHHGLGGVPVGASLSNFRLERRGVDPGDYLAPMYGGVEIGGELLDLARDLGPDLNRRDSVEVARRGDGGDERPALGPLKPVLGNAFLILHVEIPPDPRSHSNGD